MAYSIGTHFHPSSSSSSSPPPLPSSAFQNMPLYDPTAFLPMLVSGHASFRSLLDVLSAIQQKAHEFEGMLHLGRSGLAYHEVASSIAALISQLVVEATGTLERFSISLPQVIAGDLHLHNLSASELEPIEVMHQCIGGFGPNLVAAPNNSLHSLIDNNNYDTNSDGLLPNKVQSNRVGRNIATIVGMGLEDIGSEREEEEEEEEEESASGDKGGSEETRVGESYELVEMEAVEILAEHTHFCEICGKGFKRDANLRMHRRGHGDEYKTPAALARSADLSPSSSSLRVRRYSCPLVGCKRNKQHRRFCPLKTLLCVKNHYRRSHCPKILTCTKCCAKSFSVVADLKTHEKHCGRRKWECSCGTTFSRKDKLFGHVNLFLGHTPMQPTISTIATTTTTTTSTTNKNPNTTTRYCPTRPSVKPTRFVSNPILVVDNNNNNTTAHIAKAGGLQGLSDENLISCSSDLQDLLTSNFLRHSSAPRPY